MIRVLIAPDKFKGSLTAHQVCTAIREGLLIQNPETVIECVPLADGGEGTAELLTQYFGGTMLQVEVVDPLFNSIIARYGESKNGTTAFIEMASASGLQLVEPSKRNPLETTTFGTGQLIMDAINRGVSKIILGIGGSATNDAGIGMATALGFKFLDEAGKVLEPVGKNLNRIHFIDDSNIHPQLKSTAFITLCDVTNPLYGPDGAAFVYAQQKGASPDEIILLDDGLRHFKNVIDRQYSIDVNFPGAGAAGGLGAGAKAFLKATLTKGMDYVLCTTALEEKIEHSDIIITGEGKLDQQSLSGKVVSEVSRLAKRKCKPVIVACGICELDFASMQALAATKIITLVSAEVSPTVARQNASALLREYVSRLNLQALL